MTDRKCETCVYYDAGSVDPIDGIEMWECRVNPPVMISVSEILFRAMATVHPRRDIEEEDYNHARVGVWPVVSGFDWCGSYKGAEQP